MPQTTTPTPMRDRRLLMGMTLRALAKACADKGVPVENSQLSKIERGISTPRPALRAVLAEVLGLGIDDFEAAPERRSA